MSINITLKKIIFFAVIIISAISCKPDPITIKWTPIDFNEVKTVLNNPTGDDKMLTSGELQTELEESLGLDNNELKYFFDALGVIVKISHDIINKAELKAPGDGTTDTETDKSDKVAATKVYVEYSCQGSDPDHIVTDYTSGTVKISSTLFSLSEIKKDGLVLSGDIFTEFSECVDGEYTISGNTPGHINPDNFDLALTPHIEIIDSNNRKFNIDEPVLIEEEFYWILITTKHNGSYTFGISKDNGEVIAGTKSGFYNCVFSSDILNCITPY